MSKENVHKSNIESLKDGNGIFLDGVHLGNYYGFEIHDDGEIIFIKRMVDQPSVITELQAKENEWISVEEDQRGKEKLFMTILTKIYGKDHRHRATVNAILGIMLIDLHMEQLSLIKHGISVMVKHYESGTFSYTIMKHNGDATGWNKISPFMAQSFDNYRSALEGGIKFFKEWEIENKQTDKLKP